MHVVYLIGAVAAMEMYCQLNRRMLAAGIPRDHEDYAASFAIYAASLVVHVQLGVGALLLIADGVLLVVKR